MPSMQDLDSLLDDLEEKNGQEDEAYSELVHDFQKITDDIRNLEKRIVAALSI